MTGDAGGDAVLVAVNAGDQPVEVPAFAPQLGGATLRDVPLPDTGGGAASVTVEPDGRLAVPVPAAHRPDHGPGVRRTAHAPGRMLGSSG